MKKYLAGILIFLSLLNVTWVIIKNKSIIFEKFDPKVYEKKYYQSQWVIPNSKTPISDEELFAYAGYHYIRGENPILINPETPPLGKYIMGASIFFFGNFRILAIASALLSLILIAQLIYKITKSWLSSAVAVFLTSINSLFIDQIIHSGQHDIYQLLFLLIFIFFFLIFLERRLIWALFLAGIAFGEFISIKAFFLYYFFFAFWLILFFLIQIRQKKLKFTYASRLFIILNVIALLTFTLSYTQYFLHNGTLRGFLGVQKWIYLFYSASQIDRMKLLGNYLSLTLFNRWRFWSEGYPIIRYENWSLLWPIIFLFGMFAWIKLFFSKLIKSNMVALILSFIVVYNIFLFIIPVFPRYLLLLFVPLNLLVAIYFGRILNKYV